jgi:hypothetical protein
LAQAVADGIVAELATAQVTEVPGSVAGGDPGVRTGPGDRAVDDGDEASAR